MTELEKKIKAKIPGEDTGIEIKHSLCAVCSPGHHCGVDCYVKDGEIIRVEGTPDAGDAAAFAAGLQLDDGLQCLPARLEPLGPGECLVTLREGKFHQVKRMLASRGAPVTALRRLSIGGLALGDELSPGGWRELDAADIEKLFGQDALEN